MTALLRRLRQRLQRRPSDYTPQEDTPWRIPGGRWDSFSGWEPGRGGLWTGPVVYSVIDWEDLRGKAS